MEWRSSVTRHRQCSPSEPRDSTNILRFRQPRDSGGNYSYIILVFVACHSVSLGVRGSPREPNPTSPLTGQPRVTLGSARCGMLGVTLCYVDVYFRKSSAARQNYRTKQQGGRFFLLFRFDELGPTFMRLLPRSGRWCGLPSICVALPYLPPLPPIGARNKSVPERAALSKMEHHTGSSGIH